MADEEDDTIDKLSDDLLRQIIGLLPIKDALRTSMLSSRWRNLFNRTISNIDIDDFSFRTKEGESSFLDSIDRLLIRHPSHIKRFACCKVRINGDRIHRWISRVLKHNVQELRILSRIYSGWPGTLNLGLFKSESLTVLEIDMGINSSFLGSSLSLCSVQLPSLKVHLPSLKRLKLWGAVFLDNHSIQQFFSNLPKLQQLCLHRCNWEKVNRLIIDIPPLEEVDVCIFGRHKLDCQVTVIAPNLTSFICETDFSIDFLLSSHSMSLNVILNYDYPNDDADRVNVILNYDYPNDDDDRLAVIRLLESVKNLMSLHLTWDFSEWLRRKRIAVEDLPLFRNLNHIQISGDHCFYNIYNYDNLEKIFMFLHKTPNLQSLAITLPDWNHKKWKRYGWPWEYDWLYGGDVPSCVIHEIKNFSISTKPDGYPYVNGGVSDYSMAIGLIKNLMNHSWNLETLEVNWLWYYSSPLREVLDEIERHPRYSELKSFSCSSINPAAP